MPDYTPLETAADFNAATVEAAPPKLAVTLDLDADLVAWFQEQHPAGTSAWKDEMNDILRFFRDSQMAHDANLEVLMQQEGPEPG